MLEVVHNRYPLGTYDGFQMAAPGTLFVAGPLQGAFLCPPPWLPMKEASDWTVFEGHFSGTTFNGPHEGGEEEKGRKYSVWNWAQK